MGGDLHKVQDVRRALDPIEKTSLVFAITGALFLAGCSSTPAPIVVDEENAFETTQQLEAEGFDLELCRDTLFWETYEEINDADPESVFLALSIVCAQEGIDLGDAEAFNTMYQERYDAIE